MAPKKKIRKSPKYDNDETSKPPPKKQTTGRTTQAQASKSAQPDTKQDKGGDKRKEFLYPDTPIPRKKKAKTTASKPDSSTKMESPKLIVSPTSKKTLFKSGIPIPSWFPLMQALQESSSGPDEYEELVFDEKSEDPLVMVLNSMVSNLMIDATFGRQFFIPLLQFIYSGNDKDSKDNFDFPFVQDMGFIIFTPLFFLRHLWPTIFIKYMACRTASKPTSPFQVYKSQVMKTNHQFHVGFIDGSMASKLPETKELQQARDKLVSLIQRFYKRQFDSLKDDEYTSMKDNIHRGCTYFVYGTDPQGGSNFHILSCILFSADKSGIWINWFAVTSQKYVSIMFGNMSPEVSFRRTGLGVFLLNLVQF
jgi:hypothetical protein